MPTELARFDFLFIFLFSFLSDKRSVDNSHVLKDAHSLRLKS